MKIIGLLLVISFIIPTNFSYATCAQSVKILSKGQPVPCDGIFFSEAKEKELKIEKEKSKLTLEQLQLQNSMLDLYKKDVKDAEFIIKGEREKSELWRNAAENSTRALIKEKRSQNSRDIWMILLGISLTVGAGFAVGAASK